MSKESADRFNELLQVQRLERVRKITGRLMSGIRDYEYCDVCGAEEIVPVASVVGKDVTVKICRKCAKYATAVTLSDQP